MNEKKVRAFLIMYEDGSYDAVREGMMVHKVLAEDGISDINVNSLNISPKEGLEMLKYVQECLIKSVAQINKAHKVGMDFIKLKFEGEEE